MSFKLKRNMVMMVLMMAIAFLAIAFIYPSETFAYNGEGTEQDPYEITSSDDWADFVVDVRMGETGGYYKLTNDIAIESTVGTANNPFTGHFDGNDHKITADISDSGNDGTAPFRYIRGATIEKVNVDGAITGKQYAAGLVGFVLKASDGSSSTIENNTVSVTINGGVGENAGGIIARQEKGASLIIKNCRFNGAFSGGKNYAGGILGWSEGGSLVIEDCLFHGSYTGSGKFHPIALKNNSASVQADITGAYYASTAEPDMRGDTSHVVTEGIMAYARNDADVSNMHFYKAVKINGNNTNYFQLYRF